jgi:predicted dehydrogenase
MMRLAVSAPDSLLNDLAGRLHGATVDRGDPEMPSSCAAAAFLDPLEMSTERAQRCLHSGQHVLLLAGSWLSESALGRLSTAARDTGTRLAVLSPERFLPSRQLIREQLDSGRLGLPGLVRIHRWAHSAGSVGEMPVPLLLDLDIATWLMGEAPDRVYAVEAQHNDGTGLIGRPIQMHLGFPGGGMALIDFADVPPGRGNYQSLSLIGSRGAAYADDQQNMQLLYGRASPPHALQVRERSSALVALVQSFVTDLLQEETESTDSGATWIRVLEIARAARGSVASRQAVGLAF